MIYTWVVGVGQLRECLPNIHEALCLIPKTPEISYNDTHLLTQHLACPDKYQGGHSS